MGEYWDVSGRRPSPPTPTEEYLKSAAQELARLVEAMTEKVSQDPEPPVVNVTVQPSRMEADDSGKRVADELQALVVAITALAGRKQEAPVVNVESTAPEITFPEVKIPEIRMPDIHIPQMVIPPIVMPEIRMPDINIPAAIINFPRPSMWKFKHKYNIHGKLEETTATPID